MNTELERKKQRFYSKVNIDSSEKCWEWCGTIFDQRWKELPYGQFWWGEVNGKDKTISAHRASWILHNGEILNKLHVLHKCSNSKCVNPNHLYLGTHENNMKDRDNAARTSRGMHRYNFKRTSGLKNKAIELRKQDLLISEVCKMLNIGKSTYFRLMKQNG